RIALSVEGAHAIEVSSRRRYGVGECGHSESNLTCLDKMEIIERAFDHEAILIGGRRSPRDSSRRQIRCDRTRVYWGSGRRWGEHPTGDILEGIKAPGRSRETHKSAVRANLTGNINVVGLAERHRPAIVLFIGDRHMQYLSGAVIIHVDPLAVLIAEVD